MAVTKNPVARFPSLFLAAGLFLTACGPKDPSTSALTGGFVMDNGGDQITCSTSSRSPFSGDYTLDYVLTYDAARGTSDDPSLATWEEYRDRIIANLERQLPAAATGFREYLRYLLDDRDANPRSWKASSFDLVDLSDEQIISEIPANCLRESSGAPGQVVANLRQMARRREFRPSDGSPGRVFYYYDHERVTRLRRDLPLQFSYLVVHEWLWDYTDSAWINRTINRVFQSRAADGMDGATLKDYLRSLGIPNMSSGGIEVRSAQERQMRESFASDPLCRFDQRYSVDFLPLSPSIAVAPGQTRTMPVTLPSQLPNLASRVCGMALMVTHGGGSALKLKLRRGFAEWSGDMAAASAESLSIFSARCLDEHCIQRSGAFPDMLTVSTIPNSKWSLEVSVPQGASTSAQILRPQLVFVSMAPTR